MLQTVFVGVDEHNKSIAVKMAKDKENPIRKKFGRTQAEDRRFKQWVETYAQGAQIILSYEAGPTGPRFARQVKSWGWKCHVLAPHALDRSPKRRYQKCDYKDAERALEAIKNHYLAGSKLTECWLPDEELFDHREIVRGRLDLGDKIGKVKNQINTLCRRYGTKRPETMKTAWTKKHIVWLKELSISKTLNVYAGKQLASLLRQLDMLYTEEEIINKEIEHLSKKKRYNKTIKKHVRYPGIGLLSAMVYTLEIGEAHRFKNRRQIGAYFGLVPKQDETGEQVRKGRITRAGQPRVRKILNQAAWAVIRFKPLGLYEWYLKVAKRRGKKKAIVALMRRLAVIMWHRMLETQTA